MELDYLFLDASHFKMHDGSRAEPILAAWGITTAGKPVFAGKEPSRARPCSTSLTCCGWTASRARLV